MVTTTSFLITVALFALGIVLIVKGGDFFVDAASWIAEVSGIPKLIIGATIVSLATTMPEMLVSVMAALEGKVDMSIGNAVGSVTANVGLIMGVSLVFIPSIIKRKDYLLKSILMLSAAAITVVCGLSGSITLPFCIVLIGIFVIFIIENVRGALKATKNNKEEKNPELKSKKSVVTNIFKFIFGTIGIVVGAQLLVNSGSDLARILGISERIIGVTLVAVGTSLPELITTLTAIRKKQASLSVGNIIGANILDLSLIMPIASLITGKALPVASSSAMVDLPACLLVSCIALIPSLITQKFARWQGFTLLAVYAVYIGFTCFAL